MAAKGQLIEAGNSFIRLAPNAKLVMIGTCISCQKEWPVCKCGYPKGANRGI